jgi:hypothetical protein
MTKLFTFVAGIAVGLIIAGAMVVRASVTPTPIWVPAATESHWACPPGYSVLSDEREAIAGLDSAHCVK